MKNAGLRQNETKHEGEIRYLKSTARESLEDRIRQRSFLKTLSKIEKRSHSYTDKMFKK